MADLHGAFLHRGDSKSDGGSRIRSFTRASVRIGASGVPGAASSPSGETQTSSRADGNPSTAEHGLLATALGQAAEISRREHRMVEMSELLG